MKTYATEIADGFEIDGRPFYEEKETCYCDECRAEFPSSKLKRSEKVSMDLCAECWDLVKAECEANEETDFK